MNIETATPNLTDRELADLHRAKLVLERPDLTARLAQIVGAPLERGFRLLPIGWQNKIQAIAYAALLKSLKLAVLTIDTEEKGASELFHKIAVGAAGGLGGAFGLAALPLELPFSTTMMLRSIAEVAREEGHDLHRLEIKLACLEVFALGGRSSADDAAENAYWAVRTVLARSVSEAAAYLAQRNVVEETAPAIVRFITTVASRFGLVVSEQIAAKAVPVAGAVAGSVLNVLFMDHFQRMARGHFIVKRLEAKYGIDAVKMVYDSIAARIEQPAR